MNKKKLSEMALVQKAQNVLFILQICSQPKELLLPGSEGGK